MNGFPTCSDIYLQKDGVKIAVVRSYQCITSSNAVSIYGVYLTDMAIKNGVDIASICGFDLVAEKPDRIVLYRNCEWINFNFAQHHTQSYGIVRFEERDEVRR